MKKLKELVENRSKEQDIQRYLKDNLHLLAKGNVHSSIPDEYIVFSEFPLDEGSIDFVIFTDRSRMEIIFIEVKGADFSYLTKKEKTSNTIIEAYEQILDRFSYVDRNYESFRRKSHEIRLDVENGKKKYNSLLGENGFLHVDPNKEIKVRGIVIGGFTTNDSLESRKRDQLENILHRKIQFESWDSFLRKIEPQKKAITKIASYSNDLFPLGTRIKTNVTWPSIPIGTEGLVDEHYHDGGIMIAWDLPERPLPKNYICHDKENPLVGIIRDGFSKRDTKDLELV